MSGLQVAWFVLIGVLLAGYVILDGYDLGIGFWHLVSGSEDERRALRRAIAPYWDANEVWLITAGGALFAAFPLVYATVFSAFYLALLLALFALVFRAGSIEFVEHAPTGHARRFWEIMFGVGSAVPAFLFGVAMGNVLRGIPLDSKGNYTGAFLDLLNPYCILIGFAGFAFFAMHGALFAQLGPNPGVAAKARTQATWSWVAYVVLLAASFGLAKPAAPRLFVNFINAPGLWVLPGAMFAALLTTVVLNARGKAKEAFVASGASVVLLFATLATALFPDLVPATGGGTSLTLANSSSSPLTLAIMLGVALVGMAAVLGYTIWVRRMFRGESVEY